MSEPSNSEQTRSRLIEAARAVCLQHGFQGATVREICRRAGANVAAVNYHFGSKDGLLEEVLNFNKIKALQISGATEGDAGTRLRQFIRDFMRMLLDDHNDSWQCRMMARELADPTPVLDRMFAEAVAPLHAFLGGLLRELTGDRLDECELRRHVFSLLGQCLFYRHSQPVLQRLHPELRYDAAEIEAIAAHIFAGTQAALRVEKSG